MLVHAHMHAHAFLFMVRWGGVGDLQKGKELTLCYLSSVKNNIIHLIFINLAVQSEIPVINRINNTFGQ